MKLIGYEWLKLLKQSGIWFFTAILLVGNLFMLYAGQKNTPAYFFIFEQKDNYLAFCRGDADADTMGFYKEEQKEQQAYAVSYRQFIDQMENRAAGMKQSVLYEEEESYLFRNLQKTCRDFSVFADTFAVVDNCFGVRAFSGYNYGLLFLIIFLGMLAWQILFFERNRNLLLLSKGCRRGHMPLAAAKLITLISGGAFYVLLQEGSTILWLGWMYGYGELSRPVQSVSLFRNCSYVITVGQAIGMMILIRLCIAVVIGSLMFAVGMCLKSEVRAVLAVSIVLGGEYALYRQLYLTGSMRALKVINPFYYWSMEQSLGYYLNLNVFGYAVGKDICAAAAAINFSGLFMTAGIIGFCRICQIRGGGYWQRWLLWLREKTGAVNRRVSLLYYEVYKLLFQQKKGIVAVLLLLWFIYGIADVYAPQYYASAKEAAYHAYLKELSGPVTEGTFAYLENEEARFTRLREDVRSLGDDGTDVVNKQMLQFELELMEDGFRLVWEQAAVLSQKPGNIYDKFLLDEASYQSLWQDTDHEVLLWFLGNVVVLFLLCGVYAADEESKLSGLLRSTKKGRKHLERSKSTAALCCVIFVYFVVEMPLFLAYFHIDGFMTAGQRLCDFTNQNCGSTMTLLLFEIIVFVLKGFSFLLTALVSYKVVKLLKNAIPALLLGGGLFGMAALVFARFGWSIHILLLGLL